jgi:branched-chain amino acid aminotransferase
MRQDSVIPAKAGIQKGCRAEGNCPLLRQIMPEIVYLNGSLVPLSEARLSPLDYGFLYGYGVFETMRAYSGRVFRLAEHLQRLRQSAEYLGISAPPMAELTRAVYETLEANRLTSARVRMTFSAGEGEPLPNLSSCKGPTLFVTAREYIPHEEQVYQQGFKAITSGICRNTKSPVSSLKSLSYIDNLLARREAAAAGANEAILLNDNGLVAEGSTSNLFLVSGGTLGTPDRNSGLLPGITREVVINLAVEVGIQTIERSITLDDLFQAEEVFCTSSVIEIMAVTSIDNHRIGAGRRGPVTLRLTEAYRRGIERETAG